jgi:hypothetical protein
MTNEEMQKATEFIVDQDAQSSAKIEALAEAQKLADVRWQLTERRIRALLTVAISGERQYFDRIYREYKRNYRRNGR